MPTRQAYSRRFWFVPCMVIAVSGVALSQVGSSVDDAKCTHDRPCTSVSKDGRFRLQVETNEKTEQKRFAEFIDNVGFQQRQMQAVRDKGIESTFQKTDWGKVMNIREDEARAMVDVLEAAFIQIQSSDDNYKHLLIEGRRDAEMNGGRFNPEIDLKLAKLIKEPSIICERAIAEVKQALGPDAFMRVNSYLIGVQGHDETMTTVTPIAKSSSPHKE